MAAFFTATAVLAFSAFLTFRAWRRRVAGRLSSVSTKGVLLAISVPKGSEKMPLAAEQMFAALHGLLKVTPGVQEHIGFEIGAGGEGIFFYSWVPAHLRSFVESQIYAQYPNAEIREAKDYADSRFLPSGAPTVGAAIALARENFFPIRTFKDFEVDPLAAVTGALSEVGEGERVFVQILLRPIGDVWQGEGHDHVEKIREGISPIALRPLEILVDVGRELASVVPEMAKQLFHPGEMALPPVKAVSGPPRLSAGTELDLKLIEEKLGKMGFEVSIRILVSAADLTLAHSRLRAVTASFRQFSTANLNSFSQGAVLKDDPRFVEDFKNRVFPDKSYILNTEELASIFHLPNVSVETPAIAWSLYKKGEPPLNLPVKDCTFFAQTTFRDRLVGFGIKRDDRRRHLYAVGKTGCGKTTMFKNMILQDMEAGEGIAVLDPHGEAIEELLDLVPDHRVDDVVIFDPADSEYPVALNTLECPDPAQKNLMASGLVDVFKKHFIDISWGPRLEYLLNNAILTLLEVPQTTLLAITRLLSDLNYQRYIVYKISDPVLKDFWEKEYKEMRGNQRLITEAVAPIQNKVGRFLASSTIRNILGQAHSTVDLDTVMNEGKILFVNLAKGKIGEDNSNLLGSLIVSRLNFMAMQRVMIPESQRKDFHVYCDEFQNFASGSFASILSEARKYHLCLNLTHQYTAQLPESMRDAIFGNVGTIIAFGLGAPDARDLALEFAPVFLEEDLISLEKYHIYAKLMIDGMTSRPFSAATLPPMGEKRGNKERAVELSRQRYGTSRSEVEERIKRWSERQFDLGLAKAEEARRGDAGGSGKESGAGGLKGEIVLRR